MRIARVFARKTNMIPDDSNAYYGLPQMFMPEYEEIHISVTFTWDIKRAEFLKEQWKGWAKKILIGGPAYGESQDQFLPRVYLKNGVTITSRGCNNNCKWCLVKNKIKELDIYSGNIIQDNNFLQCSKKHRSKVYDMLKTQKSIQFKGGLQNDLLTEWDIEQMQGLKIKELWFACDTNHALNSLRKVEQKLRGIFNRNKLRCYVLIGKDWNEENYRVREIYKMGFLPFAQLHQPSDKLIKYLKPWRDFARRWSRPAIYRNIMK